VPAKSHPGQRGGVDVVVCGASFAGLALALALARALGPEARIVLIDPTPPASAAPRADARASAISASSRRMLDALGLWAGIAASAEPVIRIEITDSSLEAGVRPVLLTYDNATEDGSPATHIVPNTALGRALADAVAREQGIEQLHGLEAGAIDIGTHGVGVTLSDGRRLAGRLLVGADGRRSRVREAAGIKTVGWDYAQTGIVTTVAHERPHRGVAVQHFLPGGPFAILPLTGNRSCITWTEDARRARAILALDDSGFLAEVERRFGGRLGPLRPDGPRQSWPLEVHLARRYVASRVALVGDAAHGVHPIAGQGLNLALRDVAALAESVADAVRLGLDIAEATALERYERWRRFDATLAAAAYDGLNRLFASDVTLLRSAREAGLGLVDRLPALKRLLVAEAAGLTGELPRLLKGESV
jgi:2-octaprenyl-6-methoxyphenol hydroxylase